MEWPATSISEHFATLTDPRVDRCKVHPLVKIVTIALCGVIRGADDWVAIEAFGQEKEEWLRTFLTLPGGIPSHDTFGRVFAQLDPDEFRQCFLTWVRAVVGEIGAQVVAVDGKTLRGSHDRADGKAALNLVSAWATASGLVLGQVATDAKSNEITAIPHLLRLLALEGATVTIDAMGCQTAIAGQIVAQRADYVLALKDNHPALRERVRLAFADARRAVGTTLPLADIAPAVSHDRTHGRAETRRCLAIGDPAYLAYIDPDRRWPDLHSVVLIESTRRVGDTVTTEDRYYLASLPADAKALNAAIRHHWGIGSAACGVAPGARSRSTTAMAPALTASRTWRRSASPATRLSITVATTQARRRAGCGSRRTPGSERRARKTAAANRYMASSPSLYTACTGSSTSPSAKITTVPETAMPQRTSRSSATSPSTCSVRTAPSGAASPPNASVPPSMTPISAHSSLA